MSIDSELFGAEWSDTINAFWLGANGCEYIAWKGSHQIFVYPVWEYPSPPSEIIHHVRRIETLEDFNEALDTGKHMKAEYVLIGKEQ